MIRLLASNSDLSDSLGKGRIPCMGHLTPPHHHTLDDLRLRSKNPPRGRVLHMIKVQ
jgi:hypothetical protein